MDEDWVFVDGDAQKFFESIIETLHEKLIQIKGKIQDYSPDERNECEQWVMVLNCPYTTEEIVTGRQPTQIKEKTEDVFDLLESLQSSIEKYKACHKARLEEEAVSKEISKNEKLQFRVEQLDRQIQTFKTEEGRLKEKVSTLELQKEGLLTRLSEMAGLRVVDNNPNIQDLSDTKRPMKLAEAFGELYGNEWTDTLEELLKRNVAEREAINRLTSTLKDVFGTCQRLAKEQRTHFLTSISFSELGVDDDGKSISQSLRKSMKNFQKDNSMEIYIFIKKHIDHQIGIDSMGDQMRKYVNRCAKLSWLMNVQDPPLLLHFDAVAGEQVNKLLFSCYTRTGSIVEYVVWPAVVYENGTVYRKGVLQPT